ncbi:MAG: polysaccharide deacetylase family protein, partial [Anaerolineales bacterium]|nr:polysaccharide deacetylase family protein [Anaerolineales bacterium]
LTRTQIKQMRAEGFTIGAHSLSHRKLGFIPEEELETEINSSCRAIQEISGQEVVPFSFPQSAGNVDRAKLGDLLAGNPSIGLLFDTKDLRKDVGFIVNRVWAERPLTAARMLHPLPEILAQAYRDAWVHEFLGRLRGRRG